MNHETENIMLRRPQNTKSAISFLTTSRKHVSDTRPNDGSNSSANNNTMFVDNNKPSQFNYNNLISNPASKSKFIRSIRSNPKYIGLKSYPQKMKKRETKIRYIEWKRP